MEQNQSIMATKAILKHTNIVQWRCQLPKSPVSFLWKNCGLNIIPVVAGCDVATQVSRNKTNIRTYHHQRAIHTTASTRTVWTLTSSFASSSIPRHTNNNTNTNVCDTTTTTRIVQRWKNSGKMGHHLEKLDEIAHRPEREAAQERRNKKKEKKAAKKTTPGKSNHKKGASTPVAGDSLDDDEIVKIDDEIVNTMKGHDNNDGDDSLQHDEDDGLDDDNNKEGDIDAEPTLPNPDSIRERMMTIVGRFQESLKSIRGAEPTPEMFDDVQVNAYGSMTPLKAVGQVVIVSPTLATIACFDPALAKDVQRAVQLTLELNPQLEEGGMVRVPLPRVSMEVREQTSRQLQKLAESCKQRLRQVRRKAMDDVKKGKDGKIPGISKDDAFNVGKQIEHVTDSVMDELKVMVDTKMNSIMAV